MSLLFVACTEAPDATTMDGTGGGGASAGSASQAGSAGASHAGQAGSLNAGGGGAGSGGTTSAGAGGAGGSAGAGGSGGALGGGGTGGATNASQPKLFADLGSACNTPDGMRLDKRTGNVILSCPNFFEKNADGTPTAAPMLAKITAENKVEPWFMDLPLPPAGSATRMADVPLVAGPMGIDFGPDGNLYVADHQYRYDTDYKSRILRVTVDAQGKPTGAEVVVEGARLSNAVMWHGDYLYLTDTWAYQGDLTGKSAIYRFSKTELAGASTANPIQLEKPTADSTDPHLFASFQTVAGRGVNLAGADGITFDDDGNLYSGKFGDGIISKITFKPDGSLKDNQIFLMDDKLTCADGIFYDSVSKLIYITDSRKNAVRAVSLKGELTTLWENADTDGTGGLLDQPAEPTVRGGDLIIANFDAGFKPEQMANNAKSDPPHTLSVIKLR